jgi:hypothetical protein
MDRSFLSFAGAHAPVAAPETFDLTWPTKLTGKHKAIFDVPEIESAFGLWRASVWKAQYQQFMGVAAKELSPVVVMRANGIALAMKQAFWDSYGIGKLKGVKHPLTEEPTDKNPALLSAAKKELPDELGAFSLDKFIAAGGVVLACNLALQEIAQVVKKKEKGTDEAAYTKAKDALFPGVILQPSGVFAVLRAQEAGCLYIRAS